MLLSPQQVAALGPAKVSALADVCVEWGPLSDSDKARALAAAPYAKPPATAAIGVMKASRKGWHAFHIRRATTP